ncbi:MAG: XdhC family protein [Gammaproteobacteria bacterium]|nr:XdhC family protein [Gammaproteobacteria bacterium]
MATPAVTDKDPGDILSLALEWHAAGKRVALATVIKTWGSSPRPPGSNLAVADDGRFEGSVSAGCVEGAVIEAAQEVIATGSQQLLQYGVTNDEAWAVGLACGGQIEILVERIE